MSPARAAYFLRQAGRLAASSPWMSAVSVLTIAVALGLVGLFATAFFGADRLLDQLGERLTIMVYVDDGAEKAAMAPIETQLRSHPGVVAVRALTREMDRERNRKLLEPELLEGLDQEAIPGQPVFEVDLQSALASRGDVEDLVAWAAQLQGVDRVEQVEFGADKLRLLFALVEILRKVGLVLSVVLLLSAVFFVFSTVRLAVFGRRAEIEVLQLVGATPWFIRVPFLLEGALAGLAGALVATMLIGGLQLELKSLIRDVYQINFEGALLPPGMLLWLFVGGPALGLLASGMSVGRYLKS
jgi:cell division transport system permease protein